MDLKIFVFILLTLPYVARQIFFLSFCIWAGQLQNGQPGIHYAPFRNFYTNTCMSVNNVVYGDTTVPLQLTFFFCAMQIKPHSELTQVEKKIDFKCHSHYERSSRKQVFFHFCLRKGFKTHVSKIVQLFSTSLSLRRHKPKTIFGQTTRLDSDQKCKFHRFCPVRRNSNNMAHGIISCYKL